MAARLRVYPTPERTVCAEPTVGICLNDLLPLLALAKRHDYAWLHDFLDDEVLITDDLYQVLQAFRCYRPPA